MTIFSTPNTFVALDTISSTKMNANFTAIETAFAAALAIDGTDTMTGALKASNGAAAAPSLSFGSDTDTGIYRKGANSLGFGTAGLERAYFDSAGAFWPLVSVNFGDGLGIKDGNGNEQLLFGQTAAAVNYPKLTNGATGTGVTLAALGDDTDVDLLLTAQGAGVVKADGVQVATISGSETLTNKTLTAPVVNVGSDATGDTYYRDAGGLLARLGVGSNGDVLTLAAGLPSWAAAAAGVTAYASTGQTITFSSSLALAHGLGAEPDFAVAILQCTTANLNYSIGERVVLPLVRQYNSGGISAIIDSTNVTLKISTQILLINKTTFAEGAITAGSWSLYIKAWKFT